MSRQSFQCISLILFLVFLLNLCTPCISVQAEDTFNLVPSFIDIAGHWAEKAINAWTARELVGGYPDGTFRPDSPISRAEFVALVNRVFGYTEMPAGQALRPAKYIDVAKTDWYAGEIANAAAVGYLGGYPDGTVKPQNPVTRQEVAVLLSRILPLNDESASINGFTDQDQIPTWSKAAIAAAVENGYMSGYPDGAFQPAKPITRAEALSVLDRAVGTLYNRAGTYGPFQGNSVVEGNVTITTSGVTLQNTTITGNLYLTEGIGEGEVTLINVTVQGTTKKAGGGRDSIRLKDTTLNRVLVNVPSRKLVRLLAQGDTAVGTLEARTPARLEEEGLTGSGFTKVIVNTQSPWERTGTQEDTSSSETGPENKVELLGSFNEVEIQSAGTQLALQRGSIANLNLAPTAQGAQIKLANQASINTMTADAPTTVRGNGSLKMLEASVDGVVVEPGIMSGETKKKKSNDAALKDLTIDGETVQGFAPDVLFYEIILSNETTAVPVVEATTRHAKARVTVTQATGLTELNNTATVLVTAENGRTQTYIINFVKATVSGITIKTGPTKTTYIEGETLDLTGLVITLTRTDQSAEDIAFEGFEAKGISTNPEHGTALLPENNKVTITHTASGKSAEQELTIISTYSVTVAVNGGTAEVTADQSRAIAGDTVTINITNLEIGKKFKAITITGASGEVLSVTETEAGKTYTFTMPAEAVTVTVELEAILYTVTFDKNGGDTEANPSTMNVAYGNTLGTLPTPPTKAEYTFIGWNTKADGNGVEVKEDTVITGDLTVYAQWGIPVSGVSLDKAVLILEADAKPAATETLTATVEPDDAANKEVTWSSSDDTVATVEEGVVTAVGKGTAVITVTTVEGAHTATCTVYVVDPTPIIDDSCVLYLDGRYGTNGPATQTWYDLSGKGNHGTLQGFDFNETSGWIGEGLQFDGVDDYVSISSRPVFDEFTLEMTFTPRVTTKTYQALFTYRKVVQGARVGLFLSRDKLFWEISSDNRVGDLVGELSDITIENNKTYTVFIKKEVNGDTYLVVDGAKYELGLCEGDFTYFDSDMQIGKHLDQSEQYAKCEFKTIRFYTRALTDREIMQNYFATKNPEPLNPVGGAVLDLDGSEREKDSQTNLWTDQSGYGNHATLQNFDFIAGDGWTGKALEFDGVNSYALIANSPSLEITEQITFEAWIKPDNLTDKHSIICKDYGTSWRGYELWTNGTELEFRINPTPSSRAMRSSTGMGLVTGDWQHITATFDGTNIRFYKNGHLVSTVAAEGQLYNSPHDLKIGVYYDINQLFFKGELARIRIYPRALSDREVLQNYLTEKDRLQA